MILITRFRKSILPLLLLCCWISSAHAQDNGVAEYKKGMKVMRWDGVTAYPYFKKSAHLENVNGMYWLGVMYAIRQGPRFDISRAVYWYEKAAALGNTHAVADIGNLYENGTMAYIKNGEGNSKTEDLQLAKQWYLEAAKAGDPRGYIHMAMMYEYSDLVPQDDDAALQYYQKAVAMNGANIANTMMRMARLYNNDQSTVYDAQKAFEWFQKASDAGSQNALFFLGKAYQKGHGVKQDPQKAIRIYEKIYKAGSKSGAEQISNMYSHGEGVAKNERLAKKWARRASLIPLESKESIQKKRQLIANGNTAAMISLAFDYKVGWGVSKDPKAAAELYQRASALGDNHAMRFLAEAYERGEGVPEDYSKAMLHYQMAAISGNAAAMTAIGYLYDAGHGVKFNHDIAIRWWKKAARHGSQMAVYELRHHHHR